MCPLSTPLTIGVQVPQRGVWMRLAHVGTWRAPLPRRNPLFHGKETEAQVIRRWIQDCQPIATGRRPGQLWAVGPTLAPRTSSSSRGPALGLDMEEGFCRRGLHPRGALTACTCIFVSGRQWET